MYLRREKQYHMKNNELYRLESVNIKSIKRIPGIMLDSSRKKIENTIKFSKERGYCMPVVLSESEGCMSLLSGAAVFEANLKEKTKKIPAVIVKTGGDADNMLFALQSAFLNENPDMIGVSAAIVQLIDCHGISRKQIAETTGKSSSWIARMESLSRRLNNSVRDMVAQGQITSRTAHEIARLPVDVQTMFAISVSNAFLTKDKTTYLVNRYLDEDASEEERSKIINTPELALPEDKKNYRFKGKDCSDSTRLSYAVGKCLDIGISLIHMLDNLDLKEVSIHYDDTVTLLGCLNELSKRVKVLVSPGKSEE